MIQRFFVPGPLPGLNELIRAKGNTRYPAYNKLKREWMKTIQWELMAGKIRPVSKAFFRFVWYERNRRRDLDNISGGGRKLILDALVLCGILENDGWKEVSGWSDEFRVAGSDQPGVEVEMEEWGLAWLGMAGHGEAGHGEARGPMVHNTREEKS